MTRLIYEIKGCSVTGFAENSVVQGKYIAYDESQARDLAGCRIHHIENIRCVGNAPSDADTGLLGKILILEQDIL